jgi:hypothetical protein
MKTKTLMPTTYLLVAILVWCLFNSMGVSPNGMG